MFFFFSGRRNTHRKFPLCHWHSPAEHFPIANTSTSSAFTILLFEVGIEVRVIIYRNFLKESDGGSGQLRLRRAGLWGHPLMDLLPCGAVRDILIGRGAQVELVGLCYEFPGHRGVGGGWILCHAVKPAVPAGGPHKHRTHHGEVPRYWLCERRTLGLSATVTISSRWKPWNAKDTEHSTTTLVCLVTSCIAVKGTNN